MSDKSAGFHSHSYFHSTEQAQPTVLLFSFKYSCSLAFNSNSLQEALLWEITRFLNGADVCLGFGFS